MNRARGVWSLAALLLCLAPPARAENRQGGLDVELWTDRGQDAVYQPGEPLVVKARTSDDAYLLVYEIDSEGNVRLISPEWGARGYVRGGETLQVPSDESDMELVVQEPVGQGFIVAIAARERFLPMPWYLRPYDPQADDMGYMGQPEDDESEGVTADGKIVGDPFVAMERIRRRVLLDPEDEESFGTAYTSYYVHQQVKYPRYICNDCHRPQMWGWWPGFDPYYTSCTVIDFRVNWGWWWGPAYWYGYVPYYYYVVRPDCPPQYRMYSAHDPCFSSWDGRRLWNKGYWGTLQRPQSAPPPGYVPPDKYAGRNVGQRTPPGFLAGGRTVNNPRAGWVPSSRQVKGSDGAWRGGDANGRTITDRTGGGLVWRQRGGLVGRGAGRDGRARTNVGRENASGRELGGRRGRDGGFQWAFPRPNRPSNGSQRGGTQSVGRRSYESLPGYQRPREPGYEVPRGRSGGWFDKLRGQSRPQAPIERPSSGRSSRYEAPHAEPAPQQPQATQPAPSAQPNRGQSGGTSRNGAWGPSSGGRR